MTKLAWLFDVDGTLVDTVAIHIAAYRRAYESVTGKIVPDKIIASRFGMPATKGHELVFGAVGISCAQKTIDDVVALHQRFFAEEAKKHKIVPLNGVVNFLTELQKQNACLGVVTGNFEVPARNILKNAGLLGFFSVISCDSGHDDRNSIVKRAVLIAQNNFGCKKIIVVGDTPSDILAGKAANVSTVAVATGSFPISSLEKEKPDVAVKSLKEYPAIMKAFL
ncbi:HAD family hydrolase [Candidatus Woesearchaeota archaeon]|nr:HAD family hydrolase [Candidatus Woesearchaeota archaeon]